LIAAARQRGQPVHAETCPQYLLLDERRYAGADAWRYIMQPPLRDPYQPAHLWQLLGDGSISALGTDHCDYTIAQKLGFRPYRNPDLQPALDALRPDQQAVLEARLGLFDGRRRGLEETAHVLNLDPQTVRMRELEAVRKLAAHHTVLEAAANELEGFDLSQEAPRLPFTQTPGGLPGLQTALPLLVTYGVLPGHLSWSDLVRLMSTNPARIFKLHPRKGHLAPGADADLVIYDPKGERTLADAEQATVGRFTPYAGMRVTGRVRDTFVRGQAVVRDGALAGPVGWGTYIPASF
jgi:dihydroorotase-like cyclic amidohydrolase